jgi:hypothetical protein
MHDHLRERINRKLDTLSDERAYQVLDYIEFLDSRYGQRATTPNTTAFAKLTDAVEDTLRSGRVPAATIAETVGLMNKAATAITGAYQATKAAATELVNPPPPLPPPPAAARPATHPPESTTSPRGPGEMPPTEERI